MTSVRWRRGKFVAAAVICAALAGACSKGQPQDDMQLGPAASAATAAVSPQQSARVKGIVLATTDKIGAIAVDPASHTLAVAATNTPMVLLYSLADPAAAPKQVRLAGVATELDAVSPGVVRAVVGTPGRLVRITVAAGEATATDLRGDPVSAVDYRGATLVALQGQHAIGVVRDGELQQLVTGGLFSADQVLATPNGVVVVDRERTAVFDVDLDKGMIGAGLRAGLGSTNAVVDRYGRVLMTDTRGGALLAFSVNPVLMRQNYPVPGAPYAIAYDPTRDLAWVTLTARNEVVGFAVGGGEPTEKYRFPTVRQPNAVAVDPSDGRVFVGSGDGAGVQVVQP